MAKFNKATQSFPEPAPNMAEKCSLLLLELASELGQSLCVQALSKYLCALKVSRYTHF